MNTEQKDLDAFVARADFEAAYATAFQFAAAKPGKFSLDANGDYEDVQVLVGWRMWRAGRAALQQHGDPKGHCREFIEIDPLGKELCVNQQYVLDDPFAGMVEDYQLQVRVGDEWAFSGVPTYSDPLIGPQDYSMAVFKAGKLIITAGSNGLLYGQPGVKQGRIRLLAWVKRPQPAALQSQDREESAYESGRRCGLGFGHSVVSEILRKHYHGSGTDGLKKLVQQAADAIAEEMDAPTAATTDTDHARHIGGANNADI